MELGFIHFFWGVTSGPHRPTQAGFQRAPTSASRGKGVLRRAGRPLGSRVAQSRRLLRVSWNPEDTASAGPSTPGI